MKHSSRVTENTVWFCALIWFVVTNLKVVIEVGFSSSRRESSVDDERCFVRGACAVVFM